MSKKNTRTRAFLSDFLHKIGYPTEIEISRVEVTGNGPKLGGRWHFTVRLGQECCAVSFDVQMRPVTAKYMRALSCRTSGTLQMPEELEAQINAFGHQIRAANKWTDYVPKETTAALFRRMLELMGPAQEIDEDIEADLRRQITWIFENPDVAATVAEQKTRWYYNNPQVGIFFITQIPG